MSSLVSVTKLAREFHTPSPVVSEEKFYVPTDEYAKHVRDVLRDRFDSEFEIRTPLNPLFTPNFYGKSAIFPARKIAMVTFSTSRTFCWQRFVLFKELAHHHLGEYQPNDRTADYMLQIAQLSRNGFPNPEEEIDPELAGLCLAIEIALPWVLRGPLGDLRQEGKSSYQIAKEARVPQAIIDLLYEENYAELSAEANNAV